MRPGYNGLSFKNIKAKQTRAYTTYQVYAVESSGVPNSSLDIFSFKNIQI